MKLSLGKKEAVLIFGILLIFSTFVFTSATAVDSNPQLSLTTSTTTSNSGFNSAMCVKGQDFVVQISPLGCQPVPVRSDLLEQQDVQVYCPLSATQLNPLINVNSINSISFSGKYPSEVDSIGFYPAQAALSTNGQLTNYPILNNIGYVVIDLKQQPNGTAMPNYVSGNLTASLSYNAANIFGLGNTNFYVPVLTDSQWKQQYPLYSFLNGKGYLRLDGVLNGEATLSVYDSNLNKVSTVTLSQGQTSNGLSIPGLDLCSADMKLTLNSLTNPGTMARLNINGNVLDAAVGQKFLGNDCQISNINGEGLTQEVQIVCSTDSGTQNFELRNSPQVVLNIDGKSNTFSLGDSLYQDGSNSVYLGYIGTTQTSAVSSPTTKNLMLVLVSLPNSNEAQLSQDELSSISSLVSQLTPEKITNVGFTDAVVNVLKSPLGITNLFLRNLVQGDDITYLTASSSKSKFGHQVNIEGFASPQNGIFSNSQISSYYQNATKDYQSILNNYPSEKYPSSNTTELGEQALSQQIKLASNLNQKNDVANLCSDFEQRYPKATEDIGSLCNEVSLSSSGISSQYISINGQAYQISLQDVIKPTLEDYGATILVQSPPKGTTESYSLTKDQSITLNPTNGDFFQLDSLTQNTATITTKPGSAFQSSSHVLSLNTKTKIGDYNFTLTNVNLNQMAQVSIKPESSDAGSKTNFTFNISIEKPLIQLTPNQIKSQIAAVNKSIATWEKISDVTGTVYNYTSYACTAASIILTAKNFIQDLGGAGLARAKVMEGSNGWNSRCQSMVSEGQYKSLDQCFIDNSAQINKDVNETAYWMSQQNTQIEQIQNQGSCTVKPSGLSGVLSSGVVNDNCLMQSYSTDVQSSLSCLGSQITNPLDSKAVPISVSDAQKYLSYENYGRNSYDISQAKDIQLYAEILCSSSSSDSQKAMAQAGLYSTLSDVQANVGNYEQAVQTSQTTGIDPKDISVYVDTKNVKELPYQGLTVNSLSSSVAQNLEQQTIQKGTQKDQSVKANMPIAELQDGSSGTVYILVLDDTSKTSTLPIVGVYDIYGNAVNDPPSFLSNIVFQKTDASTYQNTYKNPQVKYFETAPYAGVPAIVPFDLKNGWYAAIKETTPTIGSSTTSSSVDASGRVESFYLCNVGPNGIEEFDAATSPGSIKVDDSCQGIDLSSQTTYTNFNGLDPATTKKLVGEALSAIQQAAQARANNPSGLSNVVIDNQKVSVGTPAANIPSIECEDFMSPTDCDWLFNLCDPVVCPTSRCNFGGAYPVENVVQTGAIGSTLLCLPNSVVFGGTDYVPVCLPGIKAGVDNWVSTQKDYVSCLQNNLNTGQNTGICGEIYDIYGCNLFWQYAAPLAKIGLSKVVAAVTGQGAKGGGEYLNVQNAISTAQQSMNYISNTYASNTLKSFQAQSTQNVGVGVCKNFIQTVFPSVGATVSKLTTIDSPPQYTGSFSSIPYTTATVPPTSEYNVYYNIYAGKNSGVYYSVYLKNSGSSYYQDTSSQYVVDSGYIDAGNSTDTTKDFTAPSGYTQMCITVNGNSQCGYQEVSTNLVQNAIEAYYVNSEVNNSDITTSTECTSGTINLGALINLNVQAGITNTLSPSISSLGITRVCATGNPGSSTDPNANTQNSRWVKVGYCDNQNMGCWLDTQSVKNAINSPDILKFLNNGTTTTLQNSTLQSLETSFASSMITGGNYLTNDQVSSNISNIKKEHDNPNKVISDINAVIDKVFYNNQKAELLLLRGQAYGLLALESQSSAQATAQSQAGTSSGTSSNSAQGSQTSASSGQTTSSGSSTSGATTTSSEGSATILNLMDYANYKNSIVGKNCLCGSSSQCQEYADAIYKNATSYGEDPFLLLSVIMQGSSCDATTVNGDGNLVGLMQINIGSTSYGDCSSLGINNVTGTENALKNIQCGAYLLKESYNKYNDGFYWPQSGSSCGGVSTTYSGWDAALRGYIGWGCNDPSYVDDVNSRVSEMKILATQVNT